MNLVKFKLYGSGILCIPPEKVVAVVENIVEGGAYIHVETGTVFHVQEKYPTVKKRLEKSE